jgi:8-oxo-dGTP pyrophosphatase MutT (NUDIX family)
MDNSILHGSFHRFLKRCVHPQSQPVDKDLVPAAVLVAFVEKNGAPHVIFTRRTMTVATHKGQISFPGGMVEAGDATVDETALREAHEEIGLEPRNVQIVGYLDGLRTVTDFWITPVVGVVTTPFEYAIQAAEVAEVFEVPLEQLRCLCNWEVREREYRGAVYLDRRFPFGDRVIWGATGRIAYGLMEKLGSTDSPRQ